MIDLQIVANIATSLAVIVAIGVLSGKLSQAEESVPFLFSLDCYIVMMKLSPNGGINGKLSKKR